MKMGSGATTGRRSQGRTPIGPTSADMAADQPGTVPPLRPYAVSGPVVVGVDGTPRSVPALRWAAEEAWRRFAEVIAVHACGGSPKVASYAPVHPPTPDVEEQVHQEMQHLADLVRTALGPEPAVPVRIVCEPTSPVRALMAHATDASLLVLATSVDLVTGTGLGATALACVRHAPCPVVILPTDNRR